MCQHLILDFFYFLEGVCALHFEGKYSLNVYNTHLLKTGVSHYSVFGIVCVLRGKYLAC